MAAMLVFKLSCKLAMCYAGGGGGGQTLEKKQIAENRLVEKSILVFRAKYLL